MSSFETATKITNIVMDDASNMTKAFNDNFYLPGFEGDFGEDSESE